jgi:cytochrome c oxidase subunit 3
MIVKKNHPFHIVDISPWPLFASFRAITMVLGLTFWFNLINPNLFIWGILLTTVVSYQWWRDIRRERSYQGLHTFIVLNGIKIGIILFIVSEILFFFSFFWGFFHNRLAPSIELGLNWPPIGIKSFVPYQVPLLNTIILLSSGVTITWSHHALIENNINSRKSSLLITLVLGVYFSFLQGIEYIESAFCISDSAYGRRFFMITGFHGIHVLIGSTFLIVTLIRMNNKLFSKTHHFGFEAAAWYWHFVDVVWLFLYLRVYWWGS